MIPRTYEEWRRCIEVDCGIALTPEFIDARVAELADPRHERTEQFVRRWGEAHRLQVLAWFRAARVSV